MESHKSEIEKVFGVKGASDGVKAFKTLDHQGDGKVDFKAFFQGADLAFTHHVLKKEVSDAAKGEAIIGNAKPPRPPPMTRELLYRSVFERYVIG